MLRFARRALFWLLLIALGVVVLHRLGEIERVLRLFRALRWEWVALAISAQMGTYPVTVYALRGLLAALGYRFSAWRLWPGAVALVLGWKTLPAGGLGGLALWSIAVGRLGVPQSAAVASGLLYTVFDYVAFFLLLAFGVIVLFIEHALPRALLVPLAVASILLLGFAGAMATWLRREESGVRLVERAVGLVNRVLRRVGRRPVEVADARDEAALFYTTVRGLRGGWRRVIRPGLTILIVRGLDILTLQVLFAATGHRMPWSAVTLGYVYANFAAVVAVLPTGLGVLDASLALLYSGLGAPLSTAVVVTLLYRSLAYWLPIPYSLYLFRHLTTDGRRRAA